ncbi:DUF4232 domain-containing protein [Streptomyces sp. NPDC002138]|uniref:DUF4232 domain-containing protein n=1 Tax=Streptomyces sp. NPDC002138 TaxID=3154410 RepID=UPI003322C373
MTALTHAATTLALLPSLLVTATAATTHAATADAGGASSTAATAACARSALGYEAHALPPIASSVVLVTVINKTSAACTIDRIPTVTFAGLDGSARPVPPTQSGPQPLAAKGKLYAALRTDDRSGSARYVPSLAVSANPGHPGTTFTARQLGAPAPGIAVNDPITTLWKKTVDEAVGALPKNAA